MVVRPGVVSAVRQLGGSLPFCGNYAAAANVLQFLPILKARRQAHYISAPLTIFLTPPYYFPTMPTAFNIKTFSRIMIAGCCGSGKSTLARRIGQYSDSPLIHLDQEYWQAGWVEPSTEDWRLKVTALAQQDKWIMDGNYSGTWDLRLPRAELVIYLRYPLLLVLYRAMKRIVTNYGKVREDMAQGCPERFSLSFFHFILVCHFHRSHEHLRQLESLQSHQTLMVFRSPKALNRWISSFESPA